MKNILKKFDAFKVDATFVIPRTNSSSGAEDYMRSYGSLPGFFLTLITLISAMGYLIQRTMDMNEGILDRYDTNNGDNQTVDS